jgi:uncharacterized Zn finger protein
MCKHVAAALYGVGARLDNRPEELFLLRQSDHAELISNAGIAPLTKSDADISDKILADSDLSTLFGIDMGDMTPVNTESTRKVARVKKRKESEIKKKSKVSKIPETKGIKKPTIKKVLISEKKTTAKVKSRSKKPVLKGKRKKVRTT